MSTEHDPGSQRVMSTEHDPGSQRVMSTEHDPGSQRVMSTEHDPGSQRVMSTEHDPGSQRVMSTEHDPGSQRVMSTEHDPGSQRVMSTEHDPGSQRVMSTEHDPGSQRVMSTEHDPGSQRVMSTEHDPGSQRVMSTEHDPGSQTDILSPKLISAQIYIRTNAISRSTSRWLSNTLFDHCQNILVSASAIGNAITFKTVARDAGCRDGFRASHVAFESSWCVDSHADFAYVVASLVACLIALSRCFARNPYIAGSDFSRQNMTYTDVRF